MRERKATGIARSNELTRRGFLLIGTLAGAAAANLSKLRDSKAYAQSSADIMSSDKALAATGASAEFNEKSIAELQAEMVRGRISATDLVQHYVQRIHKLDAGGVKLKSVLELNPDANSIAKALDFERKLNLTRGPLHGIPIFGRVRLWTASRNQLYGHGVERAETDQPGLRFRTGRQGPPRPELRGSSSRKGAFFKHLNPAFECAAAV